MRDVINGHSARLGTLAALLLTICPLAGSAEERLTPPAGAMTVLNNDSYLRAYLVFQTPVQISKDGAVALALEPEGKAPKPLEKFQSPLPPMEWIKPEFDDSSWERRQAPVEVGPGKATGRRHTARHTATANSMICLRSRFQVEDTAQAQNLKLSIEYVGGMVVFVNGRELVRGGMPGGEVNPDTLAEPYPDDLYCEPDGTYTGDTYDFKITPNFMRRYRKLTDVAIPAQFLRQGENILALEIHRAPINNGALSMKRAVLGGMSSVRGMYAYAGLRSLNLTAAAGAALVPNVARPKGVQVWNCRPFDTLDVFAYGDDALRPVVIASPRNGVFSGRLVVSSDSALQGLKVQVSDLVKAGGTGRIPAAAVRVRYAATVATGKSWVPSHRFDSLLDAIPAEIPVVTARPPKETYLDLIPLEIRTQTAGALTPVWLTLRAPRDAMPGAYEGSVRIEAAGLQTTTVPLRVPISAWTLPDPREFRVHNFAYHSGDAVAKHYEVEMWSDRHFALMGSSLALLAEVNSRLAIVNLAINFYGGNKGGSDNSNEQSMIRWVKQPDGTYKYDFTIFDKYLDMFAKSAGKPAQLRINCWPQINKKRPGEPFDDQMPVTRFDPATGKLDAMEQPTPGTEASYLFWRPVLDEVRKRIEARGWWDVTAVGHNSYASPAVPAIVDVCRRIWPDAVWSYTAHNGQLGDAWNTLEKGVTMPVRFADFVWGPHPSRGAPRGYRLLLKPRPGYLCFTYRTMFWDSSDILVLRNIPEGEISSGCDGVSDFGADLFPIKAGNGRYYCAGNGRGTGGPACSTRAILAPGPDGSIATERFEMLREGVELGETILFLQRALDEKRIGGDLERRVNDCLDERGIAARKEWLAGRLERDNLLLSLAGEVAAAIAGGH